MKVLILNGSPRAKGSVSGCIAKKLKHLLFGCNTEICQIKAGAEQEILEKFIDLDPEANIFQNLAIKIIGPLLCDPSLNIREYSFELLYQYLFLS